MANGRSETQPFTMVHEANTGFSGGLIIGFMIGIIWLPIAKPLLMVSIPQTATFKTGMLLLTFGAGAGIPTFILTLVGRSLLQHISFLRNHISLIRKLLGLLILAAVSYAYSLGI